MTRYWGGDVLLRSVNGYMVRKEKGFPICIGNHMSLSAIWKKIDRQ